MVLSLLAPATLCNQRCPRCYLTEVVHEPVTEFGLTPADYALFVEQFVAAGVPVLSVTFQGYEVTLPRSWPYVEAVFARAQVHETPRSFITNGMLLHKWVDRIESLNPDSITVSLDGATAETNDRHRGLAGAFDATTTSVSRFLSRLPRYAPRLSFATCLYDEDQVEDLRRMPALLKRLGVMRWKLALELVQRGRGVRPARSADHAVEWLLRLQAAADAEDVRCEINDEFGFLGDAETRGLRIQRFPEPLVLYRLDPLGYVRHGTQVLDVWSPHTAPRWTPGGVDASTMFRSRAPRP